MNTWPVENAVYLFNKYNSCLQTGIASVQRLDADLHFSFHCPSKNVWSKLKKKKIDRLETLYHFEAILSRSKVIFTEIYADRNHSNRN